MAEVFHNSDDIVEVGEGWAERLKQEAERSPFRRARLCLHRSEDDLVQEMIIALCRDVLFRPHRHKHKSESFHIIEGQLDVLVFDDTGGLLRAIHMGTPGSGKAFCYRLCVSAWHAILPRSEYVVFHETTVGPFLKEYAAQFAPWAPAEPDQLRVFLESSLQLRNETNYASNV